MSDADKADFKLEAPFGIKITIITILNKPTMD